MKTYMKDHIGKFICALGNAYKSYFDFVRLFMASIYAFQ